MFESNKNINVNVNVTSKWWKQTKTNNQKTKPNFEVGLWFEFENKMRLIHLGGPTVAWCLGCFKCQNDFTKLKEDHFDFETLNLLKNSREFHSVSLTPGLLMQDILLYEYINSM